MLPISDIESLPEWFTRDGGGGAVTVSTRVRLARNVHGARFTSVATAEEREAVLERVVGAAGKAPLFGQFDTILTQSISQHEKLALHERHLAPRALLDDKKPSALLVSSDEGGAVVVNEEDHVRMQALRPGLAAEEAWDAVDAMDDLLDSAVDFAYSAELGYLTACPTNTGTGLRVSVMMHLPGLVLTGRLGNVSAALMQGGFTLRGMHGEGSEPAGYFFQISNQQALGRSEGRIISECTELAKQIEAYEERARRKIAAGDSIMLEDRVNRARALLGAARLMGSQEAIVLLATMRLGAAAGAISATRYADIDRLLMITQPGHLQTLYGGELNEKERDKLRAEIIHKHLPS
ncbi:MAG TPA: ATP--guanido phosphotransferase [Planctomycetes bacterium]|nr:ATP--guanido phosphotransferase [Planctomycetota bacterium]